MSTPPVISPPALPSVAAAEAPPAIAAEVPPGIIAAPARAHDPKADHGVPEAISSLTRTIIIALFVLTFLVQPMVIPSESMEHTLLVGDFLLMNRAGLAPAGIWQPILPDSTIARDEIVTFHSVSSPKDLLIIKRVIGVPGDRLRIDHGQVFINGQRLNEPYATFEPAVPSPYLDHFPTADYTDPRVEPDWWKQLQRNTDRGELVVPPGSYFMLGDNRNYSTDSRYWGFVPRDQIIARPLVIYFSLTRPSHTDIQKAPDDRLGAESDISTHWMSLARWKRIFSVVH
jgi:signal peptidase I